MISLLDLPEHRVLGIRAPNPGPYTLTGTNSWIVARDPAWLVDPGPHIVEHVDALTSELERRGGLGGIALTHDHADHCGAVSPLRERFPDAPVAGARGPVDVPLADGSRFGPLIALRTPGHSPDHVVFLSGRVGFTGDAVLGEGSVFISGELAGYLAALRRLREQNLAVICPGHGAPVDDPLRKLDEYIAHRLERERRLLAALTAGKRTVGELLDDAWSDAPAELRPAAAATLAAHLEKLAAEGRLPGGVERPGGPTRERPRNEA